MNLMENLRQYNYAEARLEESMLEILLGPNFDAVTSKFMFSDWYFDTYDSSVELLNTKNGWKPTQEQINACNEIGLEILYISYEDNSALLFSSKYPQGGQCSSRNSDENKAGLVGKLLRELREANGTKPTV